MSGARKLGTHPNNTKSVVDQVEYDAQGNLHIYKLGDTDEKGGCWEKLRVWYSNGKIVRFDESFLNARNRWYINRFEVDSHGKFWKVSGENGKIGSIVDGEFKPQ
jgi:hypothetical protein